MNLFLFAGKLDWHMNRVVGLFNQEELVGYLVFLLCSAFALRHDVQWSNGAC